MIRLLGCTYKLSLENKISIYKGMIKPVWTYSIQLCDQQQLPILLFYNKIIQTITNAPEYVTNNQLHNDLNILGVEEEFNIQQQLY